MIGPELQPFQLSASLLNQLDRSQREKGYADEITQSHQAFLLFNGLGDPSYLTGDGWVLIDERWWIENGKIRKATSSEVIANLILGIRTTGVEELRSLLPQRENHSEDCSLCHGTGWFQFGIQVSSREPCKIICPSCAGLGWKSQFWKSWGNLEFLSPPS